MTTSMKMVVAAALAAVPLALGAGATQAAQETPEGIERFEEGDPAAGAGLYKRYCRGCHGEDGRGGAHTFMPHIDTLTKKDYIEFLPDT
ncbi:MAG: c-type cytochrome, partial [Geminicoccaceae bacterium]|nr:c-type cytochrome [Geminicoccaceae bacterium]